MTASTQPTISIAPADMEPRAAYRLLISVVVPRPIGWISTLGSDGSTNLAPFSYFNGVASYPPTIMVSIGQRQGQPKDSLRNVRETGEFVVNIVDETLVEAMNQTAGDWAYPVSEFEQAGLAALPSVDVKPPRVANAPVALEVRVTQIVPVTETRYTMVLGRVVRFHLREGLLRSNGLVDARLLRPVARLGGDEYAVLGDIFAIARPVVEKK